MKKIRMNQGVAYNSRKYVVLSLTWIWVCLSGCDNSKIQIPDQVLEGKVNGEKWSYKSANGYLLSSDFRYRVRFLSDKESASDPCAVPSPTLKNVKALFKPAIGSFFVATHAVDDNQVQVAFEISPSQVLIASSGFMEIYAIDNLVVIGFLQAVLDDDNTVEGSFKIRLCN